ncbi:hypothetical protein CEXT_333801 [Caerostris extrusa]|uniref:Ribosomal protein L2 n=1 Tax=Caerostris extrusa TaxID=172846 RepID=A0AAV4Y9F9_CAEEX|nr:hypothetical protein CEXT_333801 [Caerostris extrusa]
MVKSWTTTPVKGDPLSSTLKERGTYGSLTVCWKLNDWSTFLVGQRCSLVPSLLETNEDFSSLQFMTLMAYKILQESFHFLSVSLIPTLSAETKRFHLPNPNRGGRKLQQSSKGFKGRTLCQGSNGPTRKAVSSGSMVLCHTPSHMIIVSLPQYLTRPLSLHCKPSSPTFLEGVLLENRGKKGEGVWNRIDSFQFRFRRELNPGPEIRHVSVPQRRARAPPLWALWPCRRRERILSRSIFQFNNRGLPQKPTYRGHRGMFREKGGIDNALQQSIGE